MLYPEIEQLMTKTNSRYALVLAAAKRARELTDGDEALAQAKNTKPVTVAVQEIYEDKIKIVEKEKEDIEDIEKNIEE